MSKDPTCMLWLKELVEKEAQDVLASDFLFFLFYIDKLNSRISYAEYKYYESCYRNNPRFHLHAYRLFKSSNPKEACNHIEMALSQMAAQQTLPCPDYSREWVGYLHENERDSQVIDLVRRFVSVIPARAFKSIAFATPEPLDK